MKTKTDTSYGVIPVRRVGQNWEVFLIHQYSRIGKNTYWVFPKGHAEGGETPLESAERELREETSLEVVDFLSNQTFTLKYSFFIEDVNIQKTVHFFIGMVKDVIPKLDPEEVKEAGWYGLQEASERLDYSDTRQMFNEVKKFLSGYTASV